MELRRRLIEGNNFLLDNEGIEFYLFQLTHQWIFKCLINYLIFLEIIIICLNL